MSTLNAGYTRLTSSLLNLATPPFSSLDYAVTSVISSSSATSLATGAGADLTF